MSLVKLVLNLAWIVEFLRTVEGSASCRIHDADVLCEPSTFSYYNRSSFTKEMLTVVGTLHLNNAYYTGSLPETTKKLIIEDYPYATFASPFTSSATLTALSVEHTRLTTFPPWLCTYNRNLSFIELDYSPLQQILEHDLNRCAYLYILRITNTNLRRFTGSALSPVSAQFLYLHNNNLTQVSDRAGLDLRQFSALHLLDLSFNRISTIPSIHFNQTPSLAELDLSSNRLQFFDFTHLLSLETVDLRGNPLLDVDQRWHTTLPRLSSIQFPNAYFCCQWKDAPARSVKKTVLGADQTSFSISFHTDPACSPAPNPMTPCERLLPSKAIRLLFLMIVGVSVISNLTALIIPIGRFVTSSHNRWSISTLFSSNLALADLISSIYLILVAVMDLHSRDNIYRSTQSWLRSYSCTFAGFVYILGSQSSIYALALLTFERFYTILFSFKRQTQWPVKFTLITIAVGWLASLFLASLPLAKINSFRANTLCVPFRMETFVDRLYLSLLMVVDLCFLTIIVVCNGLICFNFSKSHVRTLNDARTTVKILSLVFAICISRVPAVVYIFVALITRSDHSAGHQALDFQDMKLIILFLQPFSSCFNPFMYSSLSTLQWTSATSRGYERPKPARRSIRLSQLRSKSVSFHRDYHPLRMMSITSLDYRCSSLPETP